MDQEVLSNISRLNNEYTDLQNMEKIRNDRLSRVPDEPEIDKEDCQLVVVNHCNTNIGRIQRLFRPTEHMQSVYDWVGSVSFEPRYFELYEPYIAIPIYPTATVSSYDRVVLQIKQCDAPIPNDDGESITFSGHHVNYVEVFEKVNCKRLKEKERLNPVFKSMELDRSNAFEDLFNYYQSDSDIVNHEITVMFKDEKASGNGVAREAYSIFVEQLLFKSFEGKNVFLPMVLPEFSEEEYQIVGKIFYHFFILFGLFPLQLCKVSMIESIYSQHSKSDLLADFLAYIPESQTRTLEKALYQTWYNQTDVVNVVSQYGIRSNPSKANIADLVSKIAKDVLLVKPRSALNAVNCDLKNFFVDISNGVQAVYESATPTKENILQHIDFPDAQDPMEEKAFEFMRRYIDEASNTLLQSLLRYVTGCSVILPGIRILISSQIMNDLQARPVSQTCVKTLIIPRNMNTYHSFNLRMTYYFENKDLWAMED